VTVRVKFCGFTRAADVQAAVAAGADAIGFNLAQGPRRISVEHAALLARLVPPFCTSVALFVDADLTSIVSAMQRTRCQVVQLHGQEPPDLAEALRSRFAVVKAFRIAALDDLDRIAGYPADAYLLDAYVPGVAGGTGAQWNHEWLAGQDYGRPVIVAGGLSPVNVADIVRRTTAYGVDVASGIESAPGIKDPARMADFIAQARRT
jgi:phosphoribosylanthranilate isomerase